MSTKDCIAILQRDLDSLDYDLLRTMEPDIAVGLDGILITDRIAALDHAITKLKETN